MAQLGKARKSGSPTPATARKIGILLDLVRNRKISLSGCAQTYGASNRTLLRDLQELRSIGETVGFRIGDRAHGDTFELSEFTSRPKHLVTGEKRLRLLMTDLASRLWRAAPRTGRRFSRYRRPPSRGRLLRALRASAVGRRRQSNGDIQRARGGLARCRARRVRLQEGTANGRAGRGDRACRSVLSHRTRRRQARRRMAHVFDGYHRRTDSARRLVRAQTDSAEVSVQR